MSLGRTKHGYEIVAIKTRETIYGDRVIIAKRDGLLSELHPYVVWYLDSKTENCEHGVYCENFNEAQTAFDRR